MNKQLNRLKNISINKQLNILKNILMNKQLNILKNKLMNKQSGAYTRLWSGGSIISRVAPKKICPPWEVFAPLEFFHPNH